MRSLLFILILAVAAIAWWREKTETLALQARVAALQPHGPTAADLRRTGDALRARLPTPAELRQLNAASTEAARLTDVLGTLPPAKPTSLSVAPIGEWSPVSAWSNRGTLAPRDTVETALWAAAGGDVATLATLLEVSPELRAQVEALIARLPPDARSQYPNAEALIAAIAIKNMPTGPAQIIWSQQADADNALLAVFVQNPNVPFPPVEAVAPPPAEATAPARPEPSAMTREEAMAAAMKEAEERKQAIAAAKMAAEARKKAGTYADPPSSTPAAHTSMAFLSLHRTDAGWRLTVPAGAVTRLARELGVPAAPVAAR